MEWALYNEEKEIQTKAKGYSIDAICCEHTENDNIFVLKVSGRVERSLSFKCGDSVSLNSNYGNVYEGYIITINGCDISIRLMKSYKLALSHHYQIEPTFSRSVFKKQYDALRIVPSERGLGLDFLFPPNEIGRFRYY